MIDRRESASDQIVDKSRASMNSFSLGSEQHSCALHISIEVQHCIKGLSYLFPQLQRKKSFKIKVPDLLGGLTN